MTELLCLNIDFILSYFFLHSDLFCKLNFILQTSFYVDFKFR